jgi:hypothetical protein
MGLYKNFFKTILEQDEVENVENLQNEIGPDDEQAAMQAELDSGTKPEAFDSEGTVEIIRKESLAKQKKVLSDWVSEIERFIEYVNGVNDISIQAQLHNAGCDTLFEKIASSEHRRISRIAVELSGLSEALKGYLIAGDQE